MWAEKQDPVSNYKRKYGRKEWWEGKDKGTGEGKRSRAKLKSNLNVMSNNFTWMFPWEALKSGRE